MPKTVKDARYYSDIVNDELLLIALLEGVRTANDLESKGFCNRACHGAIFHALAQARKMYPWDIRKKLLADLRNPKDGPKETEYRLSDSQKQAVRNALASHCGGTPLQPLTDFVVGLLGPWVIALLERRDTIFPRETP